MNTATRLLAPVLILLSFALLLSGSNTVLAQGPAVTGPEIQQVDSCRWDVFFNLSGFAPNSIITVSNDYEQTTCEGNYVDSAWTQSAGPTDANGNLRVGYIHGGPGPQSHNFTFTDEQGNSVSVSFTYNGSGAPPPPPPPPAGPVASLGASPNLLNPGETVTAHWSQFNPSGNDWVSLHPVDTPDSSVLSSQGVEGTNGSRPFTAPNQPGWYHFRLFRNGEKVATSNSFQVAGDNPPPPPPSSSASLGASPNQVSAGQTVTVHWSQFNPSGNDWVSLHPVDTPDSSVMDWKHIQGDSGSTNFNAPNQNGWYHFRLFKNSERVATSNSFQVVGGDQPNIPTGNVWQRGNTVGLCKGTEIRVGSGLSHSVHTIVPENNWLVTVINGPRYANGFTWWDVQRAGGGSGWVRQDHADCTPAQPSASGASGDSGGSQLADYPGWTTRRYAVDYVKVTVSGLRLRSSPGIDNTILGYAVAGHYYPLNEVEGDWGKITTFSGETGWVYLRGYTEITLDPNRFPITPNVEVDAPYVGWDLELASFLMDCGQVSYEGALVLLSINSGVPWQLAIYEMPPEDVAECIHSGIPMTERLYNWLRQTFEIE